MSAASVMLTRCQGTNVPLVLLTIVLCHSAGGGGAPDTNTQNTQMVRCFAFLLIQLHPIPVYQYFKFQLYFSNAESKDLIK